MEIKKKQGRYQRIYTQLNQLLQKPGNPISRLSTIAAVLHNKMDYFFWCGFYLLDQGELIAGPYQGPVACQLLAKGNGVCWASVNQDKTMIVPNVHEYPGHIACDSRSNSEIVVPLRDVNGRIIGVLDVDSKDFGSFDEEDAKGLENILSLLQIDHICIK